MADLIDVTTRDGEFRLVRREDGRIVVSHRGAWYERSNEPTADYALLSFAKDLEAVRNERDEARAALYEAQERLMALGALNEQISKEDAAANFELGFRPLLTKVLLLINSAPEVVISGADDGEDWLFLAWSIRDEVRAELARQRSTI